MNHLSGTSKHYTKPSESGLLHKAFRISASSAATGFSHPQNIIRKWVLLKARAPCPHGFLTSTDVNTYQSISFFRSQFDGFQNRGTVIIHFNGIFHHKPTSYWGYPHFWKPPLTTVFHGPLSSTASPVSNGPIDKPTKFNHDEVRIKCQKVLKQKKKRVNVAFYPWHPFIQSLRVVFSGPPFGTLTPLASKRRQIWVTCARNPVTSIPRIIVCPRRFVRPFASLTPSPCRIAGFYIREGF